MTRTPDAIDRIAPLQLPALLAAMPKAELHIHLEGAIAPATLLRLAARHGRRLPADDVEGLQAWYRFTTFRHFIEVYLAGQACLRAAEDFALIAYELGADRARQAIRYSEVTVTPYTHIWQQKGIRPAEIIEGLEDGRGGQDRRASGPRRGGHGGAGARAQPARAGGEDRRGGPQHPP